MARRGLLQPVRYQAERRQLAAARREVFVDPPARRNRVWQVDFSAFETTTEGTWQLCGAVDEAVVTRDALESYLMWVAFSHLAPHTSSTYITCLRVFLDACRRHGWLP